MPRMQPEQIVARSAKLPPVSPEISSGSLPSAMRRDRSRSNTASRLSLTCERMGPFPAPASLGVRDPYFLRSSAPASPFGPDGEPLPDAVSDGDGASEGRPTSSSSGDRPSPPRALIPDEPPE